MSAEETNVAAARSVEAKGARTLTGRHGCTKRQQTSTVGVERWSRHMPYETIVRRTTKLLAHDEKGESHEGDLVLIAPCRPLSGRKSWQLIEVVEKAAGAPK